MQIITQSFFPSLELDSNWILVAQLIVNDAL